MKRLLLLLALTACRGMHEEVVAERMLGRQLVQHPFAVTLEKLDELFMRLKTDTPGLECELCVVGSQPAGEHRHIYCAISGLHTGCVLAQEIVPGRVQLVAIERPLPMELARAFWRYLEGPDGIDFGITEETISSLTTQQENEFTGAWSFFGNAGTSAVISQNNPAVGFEVQGGVRRWLNYYLIGGAGLEVEHLPFTPLAITDVGVQVRGELTLWDERFRRAFNLPNSTFLMSITPFVAFGAGKPVLGARGMVGIQLLRLGSVWTPIRLELGYQQALFGTFSISGARAGVMLGF